MTVKWSSQAGGASKVVPTVRVDGGPWRVCARVVISKLGFSDDNEAMEFYARDLVTRMRIGDSDLKRAALRALNEALEEDWYAKVAAK